MDESREVAPEEETTSPARPGRLDLWLNIVTAVLIAAVLGASGWFGYTVYATKTKSDQSNAAMRIIRTIEGQVRKNPNDAVLRVRLGEALGAAGRYSQAIQQLNAALKIEPKHTGAYLDLGVIAKINGHDAEAVRYFKKVVELTEKAQYSSIDQTREIALFNLGMVALDQEHWEEAAGYFKAALRIRKEASDTYYYLAKAFRGMDELDYAIDNLEIAMAFDPNYADAHLLMGEIYLEKGDKVNASYHIYRAAQLDQKSDRPAEALEEMGPASQWIKTARSQLAAGDIEKALESVLIARNVGPESAEAAKLHGAILVKRGSLKDALDVYRQALKLGPTDAEVKKQIAALEKQVKSAKK